VRSNVTRRISVRLSAGGAGFIPCDSSFARTNRSISLRTQPSSRTFGGAASRTGWNDHHRFASSDIAPAGLGGAWAPGFGSSRGSGAPMRTHSVRASISRRDSFFPSGGIWSSGSA
jgi:hypothetical protein